MTSPASENKHQSILTTPRGVVSYYSPWVGTTRAPLAVRETYATKNGTLSSKERKNLSLPRHILDTGLVELPSFRSHEAKDELKPTRYEQMAT
jgi:hypothetical protein